MQNWVSKGTSKEHGQRAKWASVRISASNSIYSGKEKTTGISSTYSSGRVLRSSPVSSTVDTSCRTRTGQQRHNRRRVQGWLMLRFQIETVCTVAHKNIPGTLSSTPHHAELDNKSTSEKHDHRAGWWVNVTMFKRHSSTRHIPGTSINSL